MLISQHSQLHFDILNGAVVKGELIP